MAQRKYHFFEVGFHGDRYLIEVVTEYLAQATHFLETGTNVGSTLSYVSRRHPHLDCRSCEPDEGAFCEAQKNIAGLVNVTIDHTDSIQFLNRLSPWFPAEGRGLVCWLDAHGHGFQWPLREEVEYLTRRFPQAAIFIDDFKVPGRPEFGFDQYENQECSLEFIRDSLIGEDLELSYPNYTQHTSRHHPLRGWCLLRPRNQPPLAAEAKYASIHRFSELASP